MFGNIKDRILSLQDDIAAGVKTLAPAVQSGSKCKPQMNVENLEAGSELLEHWQLAWEDIHVANDRNAKKAANCDKLVSKIKHKNDTKWSQIMTIQNLVATQTPIMNKEIEQAMTALANMESLFSDVEISLLTLEDTIEARELQEKQLEQRFQLTMYQEKRRAEFNDLSSKHL